MKKFFYFSLLFLLGGIALESRAELGRSVSGEGRFVSEKGDSLGFIKKQLLSSAFRHILSKELKALGLDGNLFWRHYDEKKEEAFLPIQEEMRKKYANEEEKLGKLLRLKRQLFAAQYGNLNRLIAQYSVKRMTRSPQNPNIRYIQVSAKVDRKGLYQTYLKFTRVSESKGLKKLYLSADFKVKKMAWNEMGVEAESDFTSTVLNHWKQKLFEETKFQIQEVVLVDEGTRRDLEYRIKKKQEGEKPTHFYDSSLWVKLNFEITKINEDPFFKKRRYRIEGDMVLIDLSSAQIIAHQDYDGFEKTYETSHPENLSSHLASLLYGIPIKSMKEMIKKRLVSPSEKSKISLTLSPYHNMANVLDFLKFMEQRGMTLQFSPSLKDYSQEQARIGLHFAGSLTKVKQLLSSLNGEKVSPRALLKVPNLENPFHLSLSKIHQTPASPKTKTDKIKEGETIEKNH